MAAIEGSHRRARIGLIRPAGGPEKSVEENQDELLDLCARCLRAGADLVFTPEVYQYRQARKTMLPRELARWADPFKERCAAMAKEYGAYVVPWDYEVTPDGAVHNTSYILDRTGREVGRYRKTHLTHNEDLRGLTPGTEYPVFDLDFGKVGIMICFDGYYPEVASILALHGAELILHPLWGDTVLEQWEVRMRARAIDHGVHIAPCCVSSRQAYSGLITPDGTVAAQLRGAGEWAVHEIDLGTPVITRMAGMRGKFEHYRPFLLHQRNPASYHPLLRDYPAPPWDEILIECDTPPAGARPLQAAPTTTSAAVP